MRFIPVTRFGRSLFLIAIVCIAAGGYYSYSLLESAFRSRTYIYDPWAAVQLKMYAGDELSDARAIFDVTDSDGQFGDFARVSDGRFASHGYKSCADVDDWKCGSVPGLFIVTPSFWKLTDDMEGVVYRCPKIVSGKVIDVTTEDGCRELSKNIYSIAKGEKLASVQEEVLAGLPFLLIIIFGPALLVCLTYLLTRFVMSAPNQKR